ncbi:hypothetical protein ACFOSC_27965 [Streptantibioticus rubrisoli]|uniref:Uncharacterized protein n=1 Tax=Streptantibioticus rubrisoli TaxID=1387313 RepID=A0ABT1PLX5_9ACTN|nr:hypothetical protein [Streptantibioticus rubrisoli]MCQ4045811.1 hypothetical protein [Streptantibioticus rubrisoli]
MSYRQQMQERARQRDAKRGGRETEGQQAATAGAPAPRGEADPVEPEPPASGTGAYRPQPFTPDLIPEPEELDAQGPLTDQEVDELARCEAAYINANQADWLKWKAAHAVRSRKTYRGPDGTRTWPEYCDEVLGESESEVNRSIQQWPLMRAIAQQWTKPLATPASHVQALLPVVEGYGLEETARDYATLRTWAAENKKRVTAADLETWVQKAQAIERPEEKPALTAENWMAAREERTQKAKEVPKPRAVEKTPLAEPGAAEQRERESQPPAEEESHPNLGDSASEQPEAEEAPASAAPGTGEGKPGEPEAGGELEDRAVHAWSVLDGLREELVASGVLEGARRDTVRAIEESARSIADAAAAILKDR